MDKKENKLMIRSSAAEFLIFTNQAAEDGIEVRYEDDTVWLSQKMLMNLYEVSTVRNFRTVQKEGNRQVTREIEYYNLMTMRDWVNKLDAFLRFNEREVLDNLGKVSAALADFLPTVTIKAKDLATEITNFGVKKDPKMQGEAKIGAEHIKSNQCFLKDFH